jgi:PIN domain nuclease of toxin-antitoxin system
MDVILDTCALLSLVGLADKKLSKATLATIEVADIVNISSCSMFEIAIKHKKKGLDLSIFTSADQLWGIACEEYTLTERPVSHEVFYQSVRLPDHHADPFDRIIIAQARELRVPVVTFDSWFDSYDIAVLA